MAMIMIGLIFFLPERQGRPGDSGKSSIGADQGGAGISCERPYIVDGDTLHCGAVRIRLAGIDAPEMPGHCNPGRVCTSGDPFAARAHLQSLVVGRVSCTQTDTDRYGRIVARCQSGGRDLSCAMIASGHAVRRYGHISCPG